VGGAQGGGVKLPRAPMMEPLPAVAGSGRGEGGVQALER